MHDGVARIHEQHISDRGDQRVEVATGQIGTADRTRKERVSHEQLTDRLPLSADGETDTAGTVTGRVRHINRQVAERERLPLGVELVGRGRLHRLHAEHPRLLGGALIQEQVVLVQPHVDTERILRSTHTGDVIEMCMREQNHPHSHALPLHDPQLLHHGIARVDEDGLPGVFAGDDVTVGVEGGRSGRPDVHNAIMNRADVEAAARGLRVCRTPFLKSAWLSERCQADVWIKLESMQPGGSFKIRGAFNALMQLRANHPDVNEVVTASAGNHGVAMSIAAQELGIGLRVHVPKTAPEAKRKTLQANGATLIEQADYDEAERLAREDAMSSGTLYVSPYNHPDVIAGAGTVALEMLEDKPDLDAIVVPLGGGGLLAGTALVATEHVRRVRVIGAESEGSPVFTAALAAGEITTVTVHPTLADGLAGNMEPGSMTFAMVRDLVDAVALVAESSIETAMRALVWRERLIAEGAGATGVGALLQGGLGLEGARIGVMLTGRNVDKSVLRRVLG